MVRRDGIVGDGTVVQAKDRGQNEGQIERWALSVYQVNIVRKYAKVETGCLCICKHLKGVDSLLSRWWRVLYLASSRPPRSGR